LDFFLISFEIFDFLRNFKTHLNTYRYTHKLHTHIHKQFLRVLYDNNINKNFRSTRVAQSNRTQNLSVYMLEEFEDVWPIGKSSFWYYLIYIEVWFDVKKSIICVFPKKKSMNFSIFFFWISLLVFWIFWEFCDAYCVDAPQKCENFVAHIDMHHRNKI
jgi:hypothetical protein